MNRPEDLWTDQDVQTRGGARIHLVKHAQGPLALKIFLGHDSPMIATPHARSCRPDRQAGPSDTNPRAARHGPRPLPGCDLIISVSPFGSQKLRPASP